MGLVVQCSQLPSRRSNHRQRGRSDSAGKIGYDLARRYAEWPLQSSADLFRVFAGNESLANDAGALRL
jgi:hypothetical protein